MTIKTPSQATAHFKTLLLYIYTTFSSHSTKPIPTKTKQNLCTQILNKTFRRHFEEFFVVFPLILPLLKEQTRLGQAGIVDHSV